MEQLDVPPVALEAEVEDVADERDQAYAEIDERVHDHPDDHDLREPEPRGLEDGPGRHQARYRVAEERHEADERIDPEPHAGARNADQIVEQERGTADPPLGREGAL